MQAVCMPYRETQPSRVLTISLGASLLMVITISIVVLSGAPADSRLLMIGSLAFPGLLLLFLFWKMRNLEITIDSKQIAFGFPPLVCKIPLNEITAVRIVRWNAFNSGGWGIRWTLGGRWNYIAALGPGIEIDWGKKKRGFSTSNPEKVKAALESVWSGKVTDSRN